MYSHNEFNMSIYQCGVDICEHKVLASMSKYMYAST